MIAYLDNSATTKALDEVISYMSDISKNIYGNPSSLHTFGFEAEKKIKEAKETILDVLCDKDGRLIFTSGGTESNNLAIVGYLRNKLKRNPQIITSKIEHPSVFEPISFLGENGADVCLVNVNSDGKIDLDELSNMVSEKTELVSLMLVNNEVGSVLDVQKASKIIKSKNPNAIFHVDAVQGFLKVPINVKKMGVDMLSVSAHKVCGPKGIGALYVKKGINLNPVVFGGHQEDNLRSGTQNVPAISGFSLATKILNENFDSDTSKMLAQKKKIIENLSSLPFCAVNSGFGEDFSPNIINVSFDKIRSEIMLHSLEKHGVFVSSGSACSSNKPAPSHVLLSMGLDRKRVDSAIRISLSSQNTNEEIDYAIDIIKKTATELYTILK